MAVYTMVSQQQASAFLQDFSIGQLHALIPIAEGVENSNYLLKTDRGKFILTLFEKRIKSQDLPYFLSLMEYLAKKDIPCPLPVSNHRGESIHNLCGRSAAIVTFLKGQSRQEISVQDCYQLGSFMASWHLASVGFEMQRSDGVSLLDCDAIFSQLKRDFSLDAWPGYQLLIEEELAVLLPQDFSGLPSGHIHGDMFPDNIFFQNSHISGVLDFYFACWDYWAYDLAVAITSWCQSSNGYLDKERELAMIAGYNQVRALQPNEQLALPFLKRRAALRFLITRLHDWLHHDSASFVQPKLPQEYYSKLSQLGMY